MICSTLGIRKPKKTFGTLGNVLWIMFFTNCCGDSAGSARIPLATLTIIMFRSKTPFGKNQSPYAGIKTLISQLLSRLLAMIAVLVAFYVGSVFVQYFPVSLPSALISLSEVAFWLWSATTPDYTWRLAKELARELLIFYKTRRERIRYHETARLFGTTYHRTNGSRFYTRLLLLFTPLSFELFIFL